MHHLLGPANLGLAAFGMNLKRHVLDRAECRRYVVEGSNTQYVPVVQVQYSELGPAEPGRIRQHGVEDGLQVAHRVGNDLQHLRGRGLLLQRLGELARARLHVVEQPYVLNRDRRLVGELLQQFFLRLRDGSGGSRMGPTGALAFVLAERRLGTRVWPFAPLLDKVTSSAQVTGAFRGPASIQTDGTLNPCRFHSITSSARASSDGGTVRPSALAALRLMARSIFVG